MLSHYGNGQQFHQFSGFSCGVKWYSLRGHFVSLRGQLPPQLTCYPRPCNAILISLYKIRPHLSSDILKILVQTHVIPHLHYCSSVWGGATNTRLDRLQKVLHFAARLVSGIRRYDHITPTLAALGWPGVREMVARRDAVNVCRALHDAAAPESLRAMMHPRSAVSTRLTRATAAGSAVLELPRFRLTAARRLFPYRAAAAWNGLSRDVTASASRRRLMDSFRRR